MRGVQVIVLLYPRKGGNCMKSKISKIVLASALSLGLLGAGYTNFASANYEVAGSCQGEYFDAKALDWLACP